MTFHQRFMGLVSSFPKTCLAGKIPLFVMSGALKKWARAIKRDTHAIYLAARDPRTPWYAKLLAICVALDAAVQIYFRQPCTRI
jgi:hypothetical protein